MRSFKLVIDLVNGSKVWINIPQMLKMEKTPDGHYFIYLVNGEMYEIDHRTASMVENYFEGR
ncbi:MAG: hypothetical protein IKB72_02890 [Ruminococcus sp.]|nr:hypothetical protein [Oscillospiraceae bacterium]MBR2724368.1 hypothetical protein [Ruminococcus sp.]